MVKRYCQLVRKKLPEFTFEDKQELLRLLIDKVIVNNKQVIIQGVIPAEIATNTENACQSFVRSHCWA